VNGPSQIREWWIGLSDRDKKMAAAAVAVGVGILGYSMLIHFQMVRLGKIRSEWKALGEQVKNVRAALPDLKKERDELDRQSSEVDLLEKETRGIEESMTSQEEIGRLLGALASQAEGLRVAFEAIKQSLKENAEQATVSIDVAFVAPYEDLINYLRRVEQVSPFLKIARLEVAEPKEGMRAAGELVRIILETPLRDASKPARPRFSPKLSTVQKAPPPEKITLSRSPFLARKTPSMEASKKRADIKVRGITLAGKASTAIVNDEVVRVGDEVSDLTVKKILPGTVVFSDGAESYAISLE